MKISKKGFREILWAAWEHGKYNESEENIKEWIEEMIEKEL